MHALLPVVGGMRKGGSIREQSQGGSYIGTGQGGSPHPFCSTPGRCPKVRGTLVALIAWTIVVQKMPCV